MTRRRPKIVVVGAGVAGSLIASGLRDCADCEVICLERAGAEGQAEAGTGLNIGPDALDVLYRPAEGAPSREAGYLIDAVVRHAGAIHWARLQEGAVTFSRTPGVLLVGDAAHPMVPTLGQGATQACEDACVTVDEIASALAAGEPLPGVPGRVAARRAARVGFAVAFSRDATDTMLAGADPVAGTVRKCGPEFQRKLMSLYRDVPTRRSVA